MQRAQAIASYYLSMKEKEGWEAEGLMPLLAGLEELLPWLKQWHNEVDPEYDMRMGDYFEGFVEGECRTLQLTREQLKDWRPPAGKNVRKRKPFKQRK